LQERKIRTFSSNDRLVSKRRKHIAEKSLFVFLEKGYDRANMRVLGQVCGMTPGNLYHYIGSKQDILHLICAHYHPGADLYRHYRSTLSDESKVEVLRKCIAYYVKMINSYSDESLFFNREIHNLSREDRHVILASTTDMVSFFEDLLQEGIEAGEFQVSNPTLVAHDILMYGHDWVLRKWFLSQHYTLKEYIKERIRMLFEPAVRQQESNHQGNQASSTVVASKGTNNVRT